MGMSLGPDITDTDGNKHHVEIKDNEVLRVWNHDETQGLRLSYEQAWTLARSIIDHLRVSGAPGLWMDIV